jgi:hypothetical protein
MAVVAQVQSGQLADLNMSQFMLFGNAIFSVRIASREALTFNPISIRRSLDTTF